MSIRETDRAIKLVKDRFEEELARQLSLERVTAPLFVQGESGLNDNLSGVERPVEFDVPHAGEQHVQIVHSLAKWKRMALAKYGFAPGEGLYTDMNAIRRDEEPDCLHSIYVDQWDWEKVISEDERTIDYLKKIASGVFGALSRTKSYINGVYPDMKLDISRDFFTVSTTELYEMYPDLTPKERENAICRKYGSVLLTQIGGKLPNGEKHDGRAPDYDDWALNGDLLYYFEPLDTSLEIMSMGIRVDEKSMAEQLKKANAEARKELPFHKELLAGDMPLTVGGGIGQSRLCMLLLQKAHIGEVQVSLWPDEMRELCEQNNMKLL
jgi:aspartate--ammonia ligase